VIGAIKQLKSGISSEPIRPLFGREKTNAKGMIVFPGELRMYHQRHLTWRKTLREVTHRENKQ
jgi:hypothetical protein